jgi:hypothetical protein
MIRTACAGGVIKVPPGSKVRLLLSVWIKSRCSFVKDHVANPDHNRRKSTDDDDDNR